MNSILEKISYALFFLGTTVYDVKAQVSKKDLDELIRYREKLDQMIFHISQHNLEGS